MEIGVPNPPPCVPVVDAGDFCRCSNNEGFFALTSALSSAKIHGKHRGYHMRVNIEEWRNG